MELINKYFNDCLGFHTSKKTAIELLKETVTFLDEFGVDYFIISGTLLGLIRHNDFIPWDDDIDLIVDSSCIIEKLPEIMSKYDHKINFIKNGYIIKTCFPDRDKNLDYLKWTKYLLKPDKLYYWPFIDLFFYEKKKDYIHFFNKKWDINDFFPLKKVLFNNILVSIPNKPHIFLSSNYGSDFMTKLVSSSWNHKNEVGIYKKFTCTMKEYQEYKIFSKGVDVKLLTFEENAREHSDHIVDLREVMETSIFHKKLTSNCILINIESDTFRYDSALTEFKKISLKNFVHLKATYWKKRDNFITDLNYVMNFLRTYHRNIPKYKFNIDSFSEINDPNIYITDGPLACYISHLRAMIYGYLNFKDYCIIIEDDIRITNTENIEKYLKEIPDDWDIISMNSAPKNVTYTTNCYKFIDEFHSMHFYIVKIKCLETIFKNVYPIVDQIDVLISKLFSTLNIYNITDTVYQRNLSTNTQNNLYVIFKSPYYEVVRHHLTKIENVLEDYINKELLDNQAYNKKIKEVLMYDFIYSVITKDSTGGRNPHDPVVDITNTQPSVLEDRILSDLIFVLKCTKKGMNVENISKILLNYILNIIKGFKLYHNETLKAFDYGSTCQAFITNNNNKVIKVYNRELRFITDNHTNVEEIFNKEVNILEKYSNNMLIDKDLVNKKIVLKYAGESLYNNFKLPHDWKEQIEKIFNDLDNRSIYYPEFNIKNILVLNNEISFIDFGLAEFNSSIDNQENCSIFIDLLQKLNDRFMDKECNTRLLYTVFINNIKTHKIEKYLKNVF